MFDAKHDDATWAALLASDDEEDPGPPPLPTDTDALFAKVTGACLADTFVPLDVLQAASLPSPPVSPVDPPPLPQRKPRARRSKPKAMPVDDDCLFAPLQAVHAELPPVNGDPLLFAGSVARSVLRAKQTHLAYLALHAHDALKRATQLLDHQERAAQRRKRAAGAAAAKLVAAERAAPPLLVFPKPPKKKNRAAGSLAEPVA